MSTSAAARILEVSDETVRRWLEDPWDPDELLTVEEVAGVLKVPKSCVYGAGRGEKGNQLPHVRVGRYVRFEFEAIRQFIEQHKQGYPKPRDSARMEPGWNNGSR